MPFSAFPHRESRGAFRRASVRLAGSVCVGACLAAVPPALADTVMLHNGDRLTGRILHLTPDTLTLETTWAGEMNIRRYEIRAIETDKPMVILREGSDGTEWATLVPGAKGHQLLVPAAPPAEEGEPISEAAPQPDTQSEAARIPRDVPLASIRYINPKPEESGEGVSYDGRVTLSGALARGNSEGERLYVESDVAARARDWRYALGMKLRRERDNGELSASNWLVFGNYDRFLQGSVRFAYMRASLENDRFRDIELRTAVGGGFGIQWLQTERTQLSTRAGLDMIDVRRQVGSHETFPALGWGLNVTHRLTFLSAELFHDHTGFWNLEDTSEVTVRSRSGIRLPFIYGLNASLQLNVDWEGEPASGRHATDSSWLLGLGYAW